MRLIRDPKPPILLEIPHEEAVRLVASLFDDIIWDETSEQQLYHNLWELLSEAIGES